VTPLRTARFLSLALALAFSSWLDAQALTPALVEPAAPQRELTKLFPTDVSLFVEVERAAQLRRTLRDRPILRTLTGSLGDAQVEKAWSSVASRLGVSPETCFDQLFGAHLALALRGQRERTEWVVVTHIDAATNQLLRQRLEPEVLSPGLFRLVEQQMVMTYAPPLLIIGSHPVQPLFVEVSNRAHRDDAAPRLADEPAFANQRMIAERQLTLFARHDPPLGGHSFLQAEFAGDRIRVRHAGAFDQPLLPTRSRKLEFDASILENLKSCSLMAVVQPLQSGADRSWAALLPELYMSRDGGSPYGDRTVLMVGEGEGRLTPKPFDMLYPTFAFAVEVKDASAAGEHQDEMVADVLSGINRRWGAIGRFMVAVPDDRDIAATGRRVDLSALAKALIGEHPVAGTVSLNWKVVNAGGSTWQVYATSPAFLEEIADALVHDPPNQPAKGEWTSAGFASARRLGDHVHSWREHVEGFFEPADVQSVKDFLESLCTLAEGVERVEWRLDQPAPNQMNAEVELLLTPPASDPAAPAPSGPK
jgi:hypothetical protein